MIKMLIENFKVGIPIIFNSVKRYYTEFIPLCIETYGFIPTIRYVVWKDTIESIKILFSLMR